MKAQDLLKYAINRRKFLKLSAAAGAGALLSATGSSVFAQGNGRNTRTSGKSRVPSSSRWSLQ